jgi:hypothetical protein
VDTVGSVSRGGGRVFSKELWGGLKEEVVLGLELQRWLGLHQVGDKEEHLWLSRSVEAQKWKDTSCPQVLPVP